MKYKVWNFEVRTKNDVLRAGRDVTTFSVANKPTLPLAITIYWTKDDLKEEGASLLNTN